MISIVDYGMGNLRSVEKALEKLGFPSRFVTTPAEIASADKLIVPGVGAFGDAMIGLRDRGLIQPIRDYAKSGKPIFGICLGMQIFFDSSEEDPGIEGLGLIPGTVQKFRSTDRKIPHMGWNNMTIKNGSRILKGLDADSYVYFVHSYYVVPTDGISTAATTDYGETFTAAVELNNISGTQFHPEKSQDTGMRILRNFASR